MQESKTDDLIFDVPALISFFEWKHDFVAWHSDSHGYTCGVGEARDPKRFLIPGDEVTVEIDGVGMLTNPVVEEVFEEEDNKS